MYLLKLEDSTVVALIGLRLIKVEEPMRSIEKLRAEFPNLLIQAIDPRHIAGVDHLRMILHQAWEAKKRCLLYANKFELDLVVRIACDTQISQALKQVGVKPGLHDMVLIVIGNIKEMQLFIRRIQAYGEPSDSVMNLTDKKKKMMMKHHGIESDLLKSHRFHKNLIAYVLAEKAALLLTRGK
jgi:tRNA threonylcarbamoyladenosine modification (KEOPS) complex Cgi121 subunit